MHKQVYQDKATNMEASCNLGWWHLQCVWYFSMITLRIFEVHSVKNTDVNNILLFLLLLWNISYI